jgi:hypothetical protein
MDFKEYCNSLPKERLSALAIKLCDKACPIWTDYCKIGGLTYRDTVVGLLHTIQENLLSDTLELCNRLQINSDLFDNEYTILKDEFLEPVTALQDDDWELPYPVEKVFYAVYNLLLGFKQQRSLNNDLFHYVSANQAGDALIKTGLMTSDEIKEFIYG